MNWLDVVIIIYLLISVVLGLTQGLIRSLLSIIGLIVGIVLAANFYKQLAEVLTFISNPDIAGIAAFVIILLVVMGIAALIAVVLRSIIKAIMLGWVDRLGGAVFGLVLGALSVSALLAVIVKFTNTSLITGSALAGILLDKFPLIMGLLPSEFDVIRNFFQ
ncbi:MAG: CvpA family protein [Dehalococcoidales bacterium]|nr:CvpA family protein [Dehalococcoidales bacterium]